MKNKPNNNRSLALAGVVVGLVLAACGDPDDPQGAAAGAQLPAVQGPASQAAVVEAALEVRADQVAARKAETARLEGQAEQYQSGGPVLQGPGSQAAAIDLALEAHADEVAARKAQAARLQDLAEQSQSRTHAPIVETPHSEASAIEEAIERFEATKEAEAAAVVAAPWQAVTEAFEARKASSDDTDTGELVPDLRMR